MPLWKLDNSLPVGTIIKPYSYLGAARVAFFWAGMEEVLLPGTFLFIEWNEKPVPYLIEEIQWTDDKTAIILLADVDSEEEADKLRGCNVLYSKNELPE